MAITRRQLLRLFGGAAVAATAMAYGCGGTSEPVGDSVFTGDELAMLRGFCDVVIPADDEPGGADLGAIEFIEALIHAFDDKTVPLIFAGGPVSDRNPNPDGSTPPNDFTSFVPLDRVKAAAWLLIVKGSAGVPGGAPNDALLGPVIGIEDQLKTGLQAALAMTMTDVTDLAPADFQMLFNVMTSEFQSFLIDLVIEGSFCAPEYGGNLQLAGWTMCHFEGDSLPQGYSQWNGTTHVERPDHPLSTANPGADPEPLSDDLKATLTTIISVLGGRSS